LLQGPWALSGWPGRKIPKTRLMELTLPKLRKQKRCRTQVRLLRNKPDHIPLRTCGDSYVLSRVPPAFCIKKDTARQPVQGADRKTNPLQAQNQTTVSGDIVASSSQYRQTPMVTTICNVPLAWTWAWSLSWRQPDSSSLRAVFSPRMSH